jgi:taurine dioxygenase
MSITVVPSGRALGAKILGVDAAKPLAAADRKAIAEAWLEHLVLCLPGQSLTDDQQIAFTERFGTPQRSPLSEVDAYHMVRPEIAVISNILENGVPIGSLGAGEAHWHTDSSCDAIPPDASLLRAIEVPRTGGDTHFANMYAAYEELPADIKAATEGRKAIHDATYTSAGALRKGRSLVTDVREAPGAQHPLIRTHPVTKRKALYLGRRLNSYIVGLPVAESEELLDRLWSHATQDKYTIAHRWQAGDLVMWDNRCTLHRRDEFDATQRRLMHRTQISGARPR